LQHSSYKFTCLAYVLLVENFLPASQHTMCIKGSSYSSVKLRCLFFWIHSFQIALILIQLLSNMGHDAGSSAIEMLCS